MSIKGAFGFGVGCILAALTVALILIIGQEKAPVLFHILLILFINLSFGVLYIYKSRIHSLFTDIVVVSLLFFTLYAVAYPLDHVLGFLEEMTHEQLLYNLRIYLFANLCLIVGMVTAAFIKKSKHTNSIKLGLDRNIDSRHMGYAYFYWPALILLFIGACMMVYDFIRVGGWNVIGIANRMAYYKTYQQLEGLSLPWRFMITSAMTMWALGMQGKRQFRLFMVIVLSFSTFYFWGLGSRSLVLTTFLPSIGILVARRYLPMNRRWNLLFLGFILLLLSPLFTAPRLSIIDDIPLDKLPAKYWAFSAGDIGVAFQVSADITAANHYPGADASYVTAVAYALPAIIYKAAFGQAKPKNLGEWYVSYYYPYNYSKGGLRGFSPVAQAWMNGQYVSILLVFASVGFLTMWLTRGQLLQYVSLPLVILFNRNSFHSIVVEFVYNLVFIGCILLLAAIMRRKLQKKQPI